MFVLPFFHLLNLSLHVCDQTPFRQEFDLQIQIFFPNNQHYLIL